MTPPPAQNASGPLAVMTGVVGNALTTTLVPAEVPMQPFVFVTVTLYEPVVFTVIDCVVAPFDQRYDAAALEVSVTLPPAQKVVAPPGVIVAVGTGLTVTGIAALVAEHPLAFVTVTL